MSQHDAANPDTPQSHGKDRASVTLTAPNGLPTTQAYHPNQKVKILLAAGVRTFSESGALDGTKAYDLVKGVGVLNPEQSLEDAGVIAGDTLKIRSRAIPQDGCAL